MQASILSRKEILITLSVLAMHAVIIAIGLGTSSQKNDSSDAIQAQLLSPTPTGPTKTDEPKPIKERRIEKEISKPIRPEESKQSNDKPVATSTAASTEASTSANNAPTVVDLNQLVILYKPDTEAFYPSFSKRIGEEGNVEVRLLIDEQGAVQSTQVTLSSGSPRLDKAAMDLAQKIRFKPHTKNGVPIRITAKIGVKFKLKD